MRNAPESPGSVRLEKRRGEERGRRRGREEENSWEKDKERQDGPGGGPWLRLGVSGGLTLVPGDAAAPLCCATGEREC